MPEAPQALDIMEATFGGPGSAPRIDREKGVIYGVKFLGERSGNPPPDNNVYPRATREAAAAILEGQRINIDHPPRGQDGNTRPYGDGAGVARNLHEKGDGLYGDAHFNPKHPRWEQICWDAENCPHLLGFSIHARANGRRAADGTRVIEGLTKAYSIDLVSSPATTKGLFESLRDQPMATKQKKTVHAVLREALKDRPGSIRVLEEETPAGMVAPEMEAPPEEMSSADQVKAAFRAMVLAAFDDESLDTKATLAKIKEILDAQEKLLAGTSAGNGEGEDNGNGEGEGNGEGNGNGPEEPSAAQESLRREVQQLRRQVEARELCDQEGVVPNAVLRKALEAARDRQEMVTLIREHKQAAGAQQPQRPRSAGVPVRESANGGGSGPEIKDRKDFAAACFGR